MPAEPTNVNVIAHEVLKAMGYGHRVELVLKTGASMKGVPTRIVEDLARKSDVARTTDRSHLRIRLDDEPHTEIDLERIREIKPAL